MKHGSPIHPFVMLEVRMWKKLTAVVVLIALATSLSACGSAVSGKIGGNTEKCEAVLEYYRIMIRNSSEDGLRNSGEN